MRKDDYLTSMMLMPPKQRTQITPFDSRTQREAFTVSLEGLKGVCLGFLHPVAPHGAHVSMTNPCPYRPSGILPILLQSLLKLGNIEKNRLVGLPTS